MSYPQNQTAPTVIYVTSTPGTTAPAAPPPPVIIANTRWRNRPQAKATTPGGFIFLSGGMNLALSVGWAQYTLYGSAQHFCYSWFIGVIIGVVLSEFLRFWMSKKTVMGISTFLILVGGIIFTSSPYSYNALLAGRYINGIAIGLAIVTFLVNASEIADNSYRGRCLMVEQTSVTTGIAIQMIYTTYWDGMDFPANRLHGILDMVFAVLAAFSLWYFVESPIDYIREGDDAKALETLSRLRRPQGITLETKNLLEETKAYVRDQENMSLGVSLAQGLLPLVKMLICRSMLLAFCYSMPLNLAIQLSLFNTGYIWVPMVAGLCRMLGGLITLCLIDTTGRKYATVIPILFIGGLLVAIGSIFEYITSILNFDDMCATCYMFIVMQLLVGFFAPYTSVLLGEAFPLRVKPFLMDICVVVEQIIHIIFITTISAYIGQNLVAQGIIALVAFICLCVTMPETNNTTLTEAQRRFRRLFNLR